MGGWVINDTMLLATALLVLDFKYTVCYQCYWKPSAKVEQVKMSAKTGKRRSVWECIRSDAFAGRQQSGIHAKKPIYRSMCAIWMMDRIGKSNKAIECKRHSIAPNNPQIHTDKSCWGKRTRNSIFSIRLVYAHGLRWWPLKILSRFNNAHRFSWKKPTNSTHVQHSC